MSDQCGFYSRGTDRHLSLSWEMVLGARKAMLLNYIAYNVGENRRQRRDKFLIGDTYWWYHSLKQFYAAFPAWSERKIQYLLKELKETGLVVTKEISGNTALWYSIVGNAVDKMEEDGILKLNARLEEIWATAPTASATAESAVVLPQKVRSAPPSATAESADIEIYQSKRDKEEKTHATLADARVTGVKKKISLEDLQEKVKTTNLLKVRERFARGASTHSVEQFWQMLVVEHFGREGYIPLTAADRKNTKTHFVKFCEQAGVSLIELLEYCVTNWAVLRDHGMKPFKLSTTPSYRTIYSLKDRFLEQMRKKTPSHGTTARSTKVFTAVDQIPADHPQYATLRKLVETAGRALAS